MSDQQSWMDLHHPPSRPFTTPVKSGKHPIAETRHLHSRQKRPPNAAGYRLDDLKLDIQEVDSLTLMSQCRQQQLIEIIHLDWMKQDSGVLSGYARERFFLHSQPSLCSMSGSKLDGSSGWQDSCETLKVSKSALSPASRERHLLPGSLPRRMKSVEESKPKKPLAEKSFLHAQIQNEVRIYQRDQPVRFSHDLMAKELSEHGNLLSKYRQPQPQCRDGQTFRWRTQPLSCDNLQIISASSQTTSGHSTSRLEGEKKVVLEEKNSVCSSRRGSAGCSSVHDSAQQHPNADDSISSLSVSSINSQVKETTKLQIQTAQELCQQVTAHYTTLQKRHEQEEAERQQQALLQSAALNPPHSVQQHLLAVPGQGGENSPSAVESLTPVPSARPRSGGSARKSMKSGKSTGKKSTTPPHSANPNRKSSKSPTISTGRKGSAKRKSGKITIEVVEVVPPSPENDPNMPEKKVEIVPLPWLDNFDGSMVKEDTSSPCSSPPPSICPSSMTMSRVAEMRKWLHSSPLQHSHSQNFFM